MTISHALLALAGIWPQSGGVVLHSPPCCRSFASPIGRHWVQEESAMVRHARYCMHLDHESYSNPDCSCTSGRILPVFPWSNESLSEETWLTSKFNQKRGFSVQVCIGITTIRTQGMLSDPQHCVVAFSLAFLWFRSISSLTVA